MTHEDIYSKFLLKCDDKKWIKLSKSDAYEEMREYLETAFSEVYIRKVFSKLEVDDDLMTIDYELKNPADKKSDERFVVDILATRMVIAWMQRKIDTDTAMAIAIGGKEEKVLQNNYSRNVDRMNSMEIKLKKKIRDYGYQNGVVNEE